MKRHTVNNFLKIQAAIVVYCFVLPIIIFLAGLTPNRLLVELFFLLLILALGLLTGMSFTLASRIIKKDIRNVAAESYGADLFGSAIGALVLSTFLLPLLGIFEACILTGFLNVLSGVYLFLKRKLYFF